MDVTRDVPRSRYEVTPVTLWPLSLTVIGPGCIADMLLGSSCLTLMEMTALGLGRFVSLSELS